MNRALIDLLRKLDCACAQVRIERHTQEHTESESVARYVRSKLAQELVNFVVNNSTVESTEDFSTDSKLFQIRTHFFSPAELEAVLIAAFELGRTAEKQDHWTMAYSGPSFGT